MTMLTTQTHPVSYGAAPAGTADRDLVEATRDVANVVAVLIAEYGDPIDKAALREALQLLVEVALKHDEAGAYGLYPAIDAEGDDGLPSRDDPVDRLVDDLLGGKGAA